MGSISSWNPRGFQEILFTIFKKTFFSACCFSQSKTNLRCIRFYLLYIPNRLPSKPMYLTCSVLCEIPNEILYQILKIHANYKRRQSHFRKLNEANIILWIIEIQISSLYWSNNEPHSTDFYYWPSLRSQCMCWWKNIKFLHITEYLFITDPVSCETLTLDSILKFRYNRSINFVFFIPNNL
jgi:hypothetical protein